MYSYAYLEGEPNWRENKDAEGFDFISTDFCSEIIEDFKSLRILRLSKTKIKNLTLKGLPNLEAIELIKCEELLKFTVLNCPKLQAIDASFCTELCSIEGKFPKVEYFSCPAAKISKLPKMPNLLYLNIDWCSNLRRVDIKAFKNLEKFHYLSYDPGEYSLSDISSHPSLRVFQISNTRFTFDKFKSKSKLKFLCFDQSEFKGDPSIIPDSVFVILSRGNTRGVYSELGFLNCDRTMKLLYGPWGIPPNENKILPPVPSVFTPPAEFDLKIASDSIAGAIFGSAMMDMIGLGVEFATRAIAMMNLSHPLDITWTHPWMSTHTSSFTRGTATDDTSQAVLIMRSLVRANVNKTKEEDMIKVGNAFIDIHDFAERLKDWMKEGHVEHRDGGAPDFGSTTGRVLSRQIFVSDPFQVSKEVWEKTVK